jgi:uncharacterized membrane protein
MGDPGAVTAYSVVLALHIIAVLAAFGLPLAYPLLMPYVRRRHPAAMPGLHDVQHRLNVRLTGPGTALILAFGVYLATRGHHWGELWVTVPLLLLVVIGALGGAVVVPASRQMAALARADVAAGGGWSSEYERLYRRYMGVEIVLVTCVLLAVFFMAAKP